MSENQTQVEEKAEKAPKWYEKGFGFDVGDVCYVEEPHKYVAGRFIEVSGPSEKENHVKGYLQHPKQGTQQGTNIILDSSMLTLVAKGGFGEPILESVKDRFEMNATGVYSVIKNEAELQKAQ